MLKRALILGVLAITPAALAGPKKVSGSDQRKEVSITVYNQNFGLVREVRELDVGTGTVDLEFRDVAANIQPQTVSIKSLTGAGSLSVLEQNYRYDLLTPQKLLEKHVGKKVRVWRWNEKLGKDEAFDAEVLSVADGQTVMKINGEVTYNFPGRIAFPSVPDNLMAKPTLVWKLDSKQAKQQVEATYLTQNLNWRSDYVFVINDADTAGDLTGWVTLTNNSGAAYKNAKLKLVAGDVQRVSGGEDREYSMARKSAEAPAQDRFREESFFEYHLYTLQQPTDVLENEQKQVTLLEAKNAKVKKKLIYYGQQYWYRGKYGEVQKNQKVGVYLDIENTKANGLGIPLPKGTVRVYKADKSGAKQFIGEDHIDHTPRDEKVRIKMGEAFDVVGDRKQMEWRTLGVCTSESTWEIELRNHKDKASRVEVYEPIGGDWTIIESTHKHDKKDAFTFTFDVDVPANGKTKIKYKVRVKWC
ncbi:MAG: DUF4139 domain-containing protein [Myxococcales bacterium]|nr:DUF4139 domain-containing protein [Myxococcales bacterium]